MSVTKGEKLLKMESKKQKGVIFEIFTSKEKHTMEIEAIIPVPEGNKDYVKALLAGLVDEVAKNGLCSKFSNKTFTFPAHYVSDAKSVAALRHKLKISIVVDAENKKQKLFLEQARLVEENMNESDIKFLNEQFEKGFDAEGLKKELESVEIPSIACVKEKQNVPPRKRPHEG